MASIRKEVWVSADADTAWDAVRDVGAVHERLARGFVTATEMEEGARVVTFFSGMKLRELIVDVDDTARRLVWAAVGGTLAHHNASMQVFAEDGRTRIVWVADVLPDAVAPQIAGLMDRACAAVRETLGA